MDLQDWIAVFGVIVVIGGVGVWALRLEGLLKMANQRITQLEKVAEAHVRTSENIAVMRNDMDHFKSDMGDVKTLLMSLVGPTQRRTRTLNVKN